MDFFLFELLSTPIWRINKSTEMKAFTWCWDWVKGKKKKALPLSLPSLLSFNSEPPISLCYRIIYWVSISMRNNWQVLVIPVFIREMRVSARFGSASQIPHLILTSISSLSHTLALSILPTLTFSLNKQQLLAVW